MNPVYNRNADELATNGENGDRPERSNSLQPRAEQPAAVSWRLLEDFSRGRLGCRRHLVATQMLGLNRYQAHGRMRRLMARLRADFQRAGLSREIVELLR